MIAIGAPKDEDAGPETGGAYLFRHTGSVWSEEQKLSGTWAFDDFATSVCVDGGYLAVGAPWASGPDAGGRAFGYRYNGTEWILEQELDSTFAFDTFGRAVAVSASAIFVGTPFGDTLTVSNSGAVDTYGRPATATFRNGDFTDVSGDPWCPVDQSDNGTINFSAADAEVTGGDDGVSGATNTYVEQAFDLHTESDHRVTFDWTYASGDDPTYDGAYYDLIDVATGMSVVSGPITLSDTDGEAGSVDAGFSGSGQYVLRLGTFSTDNLFGPGISTFDNITITCDEAAGPLTNGDFATATGVPWCFSDSSRNGAADFFDGEAIVTGGNDGLTIDSATYLEQELSLGTGSQTCSFDWSYGSSDDPGYDAAVWDLVDRGTWLSVVGGPITLGDISGESGSVATSFSGTGLYVLRLGVTSSDNVFGAGVATFDNVVVGSAAASFIRGDTNTDGGFDISDAVFLLDFLFLPGSATPACMDSADSNDDGAVNLGDAVTILSTLFSGGAPISAPHPGCGPDPSVDALDCASFTPCP